MKAKLTLALSLTLTFLGASAATRTWTGAANDGSWANPLNWSDETLPAAGDTAHLAVATNTAIDVDTDVPALACLKFTNAAKVTLTGRKLTFSANASIRLPNASSSVQPRVCNEIRLLGASSFRGLVDTADGQKGSGGVFSGPITSPGTLTILFGGMVYCYGEVHLGGLTGAYSTGAGGRFCLCKPGNTITNCCLNYSHAGLVARNAMTEDFVFDWGAINEDGAGRYYLSADQICDHIGTGRAADAGLWTTGRRINAEGSAAVRIHQRATKSILTAACLASGNLTAVWDPADASHVQTFSNRTHGTTGRLVVSNGTMRVAAGSVFSSLTGVEIATGTRFEVQTASAKSFPAVTSVKIDGTLAVGSGTVTPFSSASCVWTLGANGRVEAADAVSVARIVRLGVHFTNGTYTASNSDFVQGEGSVTVTDGTGITSWNKAASGAWSAAANWTMGVPVSGALDTAITAQGADYTVTLDTNLVALGKIALGNDQAHTSKLSVAGARTAFVSGNVLTVNRGGFFEQTAGVSALTNNSTSRHTVNAGGVWRVLGTNNFYAVNDCFTVNAGGRLEIAGRGRINFRHQTSYYSHMMLYGDLDVSDYGYLNVVDQNGEPAQFGGPCRITLRGHGTLNVNRNVFEPRTAGLTNRLDACDDSSFLCYNSFMSAHQYGARTSTIVTLRDRATANFGEDAQIGVEQTSYAEVNVLDSSSLTFGSTYGAYVGSKCTTAVTTASPCPTGVLTVAGTAVCGASYYRHPSIDPKHVNFCGLMIGGTILSSYVSGIRCRGVANVLTGGTLEHQTGLLGVGLGGGEGEINVKGGKLKKSGAAGYELVGMGGGQGLVAVTDGGTVTFASSAYVGGVATNTIDFLWRYFPADSLASTGTVRVTDGSLAFNGARAVFGGKGTGILEIGAKGTVTAKELVLSNNVSSVLRFTLGATAADHGSLSATGKIKIAAGAKIEIDGTAYEGGTVRIPLVSAAGGIEGAYAPEDVTLSGAGLRLRQTSAGLQAVFSRGFALLLK